MIKEIVFKQKPKVHNFQDLDGKKFGHLTIMGFAGTENGATFWFCVCKCKEITKVRAWDLKSGNTTSCGCYNKERDVTHGQTVGIVSRTYTTWQSMLGRCLNPNDPAFDDYGGRGIKVCNRWLIFENFLEDMGERPENLSLDRIKNNKGYFKKNCRWATRKEQANNTRRNRLLFYNGKTQNVTQWSEELEINKNTIYGRLNSGWPIERVLTKNNK